MAGRAKAKPKPPDIGTVKMGEFAIHDTNIDPKRLMLEGADFEVRCRKCQGSGETAKGPCARCGATGVIIEPLYTVGEVAKVFFRRSGHWVRWRESEDAFILDGVEPGTRTDHGARSYTLFDVERMVHALASGGHIDPREMLLVLNVVRAEAMLYGHLL